MLPTLIPPQLTAGLIFVFCASRTPAKFTTSTPSNQFLIMNIPVVAQGTGVHLLGLPAGRAIAFHRAGEAGAEFLRGKLPWEASGRTNA